MQFCFYLRCAQRPNFFGIVFVCYIPLNDVSLIEPLVAYSFEGTGIHPKGRHGEQLDYKHQSREQAGYVLFQWITNLFEAATLAVVM